MITSKIYISKNDNYLMNYSKLLLLFIVLSILSINVSAQSPIVQGQPYNFTMTCSYHGALTDSAVARITVQQQDGSYIFINQTGINIGGGQYYYTGTSNSSQTLTISGECCQAGECYSGTEERDVTPTGKPVADSGQMGTGILYFYAIVAAIFIFIGYLLLMNESLWISYSGLFLMILGFAFIYYDLHLSNLYATTIALNSGAGNVTTGAFLMFNRFIKLAPYIVAGLIIFSSVKVLRSTIKKKGSKDGWDNNQY